MFPEAAAEEELLLLAALAAVPVDFALFFAGAELLLEDPEPRDLQKLVANGLTV